MRKGKAAQRPREEEKREHRRHPPVEQEEPEPPKEKVDEASWESFPASDPPSFTPDKLG